MAYRKTPAVKAHLKEQRENIVAAALTVVEKHGRDKFISRVVERADVSMGTIYQHFADADELWSAAVASALARDVAAIREAVNGQHYPLNALARAIAVFYSGLDKPRLARALADVPAYRRGIRAELEPLIGAGTACSPRAKEQFAAAILGALYGLAEIGATDKSAVSYCLSMLGVPNLAARALA